MDAPLQPNPVELALPPLLLQLIDAGRWPKNEEQFRAQSQLTGRVVLFNPPFVTVRECSKHNAWWTSPQADPDGIDPDLALVIGDHGIGDDSPIVLDYRGDPANPSVLYLRWDYSNRWVVMTNDFPMLVYRLDLLSDSPRPAKHPYLPKCVYCQDSRVCYCVRKDAVVSAQCARCEGSGACHVCTDHKNRNCEGGT